MKKNHQSANTLRQQAEDLLKNKSSKAVSPLSEADALKLLHELQVHQIELEMQNEALTFANARAEAALEDADQYRQIFANNPQPTVIYDLETLAFLEVNEAAVKLYGYTRNEFLRMNIKDLHHLNDIPALLKDLELTRSTENPSGQWQQCLKSGEIIFVELTSLSINHRGRKARHVLVNNITKRKLAGEALQQSNKKLEAMISASPDGIGMVSLEGKLQLMSDKLSEMHGYSLQGKDDYIGNSIFNFIDPSDHKLLADNIKKLIAGEDIHKSREYLAIKKDKSRFNAEIKSSVLRDEEGEPLCFLYVQRDITERKQTEKNLQDSENRYRSVFEGSADGIMIADEETKMILFANSSQCAMLGYTEAQLKTMNISEIHPADTFQDTLAKFERQGRREITLIENIQCLRKNGEIFYADINSNAVNVNGRINVIGFFRDISGRRLAEQKINELNTNLEIKIEERTTQLAKTNENLFKEIENRKVAEADLTHQKQRLADIIEGTNVGTWEWNVQTGETIFNKQWAGILGYTPDEIAPVSIQTWMKFAHPDDLAASGELLEKHFNGDLDYYSYESRMKHKNGEWVWVLDRGKVHTWDKGGKPLLMSGTHQDISESKRASEFEKELLALTPALAGIPLAEFDATVNRALSRIGQFLSADRAYIFEFEPGEGSMSNTYEWCNSGIRPEIENLQKVPAVIIPKWMETLNHYESVIIPSVKDLPDSWSAERAILEPQGIKSLIVTPMILENHLIGFFGLDSVKQTKIYSNAEITILKVLGNLLASLMQYQRSEKSLEQTRQNYETFFNTIDDFLFVLDEQGNIIHTNTTVAKRLGYTAAELLGKSVLMVHPSERREEAGRIVGEMLAGSSEFCPVPLITKSGYQIPVETKVTFGFWDNKTAVFGVSKDVSKIKSSEEKFSKVFYLNPSACGLSDLATGKYVELNEAFYTLFGFTENEVIGKTAIELGILNEDAIRSISKKADSNGNIYNAEASLKTKNGEIKHVLLSAENIYLQDRTYRFTVVHDISERKLAEEEINKAKKLADNANFAKSEFLARMSHELRTPMNSILGFAQLLNMGEISPAQKKSVNFIIGSGKHLLNLIDEVLDISQIEAGRIILSYEPVQLSSLIMEMLDVVQPMAEVRYLKTELEYSPANRFFVLADKHRLKQVLLNLINNAVKYNREGGSIIIKTELRTPETRENSVVRISICDTGLGINPEDILRLFIPFERIGADRTETEGTGLGLSVVKKLITAMGGEVGVDSTPGQGSTFWVELPQVTIQQEQNNSLRDILTTENGANTKTGTILYIEDNIPNAELVKEIIKSKRPAINIIISKYGEKAVEIATYSKADLILLDLNLPDSHGSEVLGWLKADEITKNIPVVIVSADAMPQQAEKLLKSGAKKYLTKPLDLIDFLKVVDECVT
jgi:PAS domain S-box-containing protein